MRTRIDCPAGTLTSPPAPPAYELAAAGGGADAGGPGSACGGGAAAGGGAVGVEREFRVNVKATMSCVGKVCTSPSTSKRRTACVPPKYFPCSTRPSLSSSVSASPIPASSSVAVAANKVLDQFFIVIPSPVPIESDRPKLT